MQEPKVRIYQTQTDGGVQIHNVHDLVSFDKGDINKLNDKSTVWVGRVNGKVCIVSSQNTWLVSE